MSFFQIIKRIILSTLLIYSFDMFAVSLNLSVPINVVNVFLVSLFEVSALVCLIVFSFTF